MGERGKSARESAHEKRSEPWSPPRLIKPAAWRAPGAQARGVREMQAEASASASKAVLEQVDILIVTILPEEYRAVHDLLREVRHASGTADAPNLFGWETGWI